jgi:UDP-glucose:(heptosyl)LPS alpha-1,3-glucosyltransferase
MRIAFVRRNWSPTGGAERYLVQLAEGLKNHGHEVHLLCESWGEEPSPFHYTVLIQAGKMQFAKPLLFADQVNEYFKKNSYDVTFSLERGIKADIYRAGDGVHMEWLRKRAEQNLYFSSWWGHLRNLINLKNGSLINLEERTFTAGITQWVIANSEMVKKDIRKHFPSFPEEKIWIIRNGINFEKFSNGNRAEGRKYLGLDEKTVLMLLVGSGRERKGHKQARLVEKKLEGKVKRFIADHVKDFPLEHLYAAADIFILPTIYDPCSNVVLEAMAAGLPVITTSDNGAAEYIEDGKQGFIVPHSYSVNLMVEKVKQLLSQELRQQMGQAAREKIREWTFERNINETLRLIYHTKENQ